MKISRKMTQLVTPVFVSLALLGGGAFAASRGWVVISSPSAGQTNFLYGVSTFSSSDAWAVGYEYDANDQQLTVAQHWDGTGWSTVPSPNPGTAQQCGDSSYSGNALAGVDAISSNDVWAVGSICGPGTARTLTVHWNGSQLAVIPSPNESNLDASELLAVSALSSNDVWAVGDYKVDFQYIWETLVEHWDGTAWTIMSTPNPAGADITYLTGV